ncbi:MAG TPA: hypothetical protein PKX31_00030 [Chitinophagaceae bacterium]|nr:hypothetical protein [Chitinophagaceae bacterium]
MIIKSVTVTRSVKISSGSYQNTDFSITVEGIPSVAERKNLGKLTEELIDSIDNILVEKIRVVNPREDVRKFGIGGKTA